MKFTPPTLIAALLAIGGIGFAIGRVSTATSTSSSDDARADRSAAAHGRAYSEGARRRASSPTARSERETSRERDAAKLARQQRFEQIIRSENALDRNRALLAFIDQLAPDEFEGAIKQFQELGLTQSRMNEYGLLFTAWAKLDPLAALDYATANTQGNFASSTILSTWAANDPAAAIQWAEAHHDGDGPNRHMIGIIRGIAENDPQRATELMAAMPRSGERGAALDGMLQHILKQGPEAARDWASSITDDSLRNGAMMRLSPQLAAKDPSGTANWLMANPSEATERQMDNVFSQWARIAPAEALNELNHLPAGSIRSNALRGIIRASGSPQESLALMNRFPGDVNNRVIHDFAQSSFDAAPGLVADQLSRITNHGHRDWLYRRLLGQWLTRDPNAADQWIRQNPLPQGVLDHLERQKQGAQ